MKFKQKLQSGQTLIETMVAAMILVIGIGSSVGLAVYALRATYTSTQQIVAMGLAREGIEAVKNIRDTNWLQTSLTNNCFDFYTQTNTAPCYRLWRNGMAGSFTGVNYRLGRTTTPTAGRYWVLTSSSLFGLHYAKDDLETGFYRPNPDPATTTGVSVVNSNTKMGRRVRIIRDNTFAPFSQDVSGNYYYDRLLVQVDVWWTDKHCPVNNGVPSSTDCKITLTTYLTNWKNY